MGNYEFGALAKAVGAELLFKTGYFNPLEHDDQLILVLEFVLDSGYSVRKHKDPVIGSVDYVAYKGGVARHSGPCFKTFIIRVGCAIADDCDEF